MSVCKWCGRRPATEADHSDDDADPKSHLCWREWNDYSDCHEIERGLIDLAPLMRDTMLMWEASIDATTREETEDLYIKAAHIRKQVLAALKDLPGGGGAVEKPRITPLPAATWDLASDFTRQIIQGHDISKLPDHPIKAQDGSPHNKGEIVSGIMDGFAQPLPNLDHIINRRIPPPFVTTEHMGAFLANAVPATSIDDDLDDVPLGKACSLDGDSCESCQ